MQQHGWILEAILRENKNILRRELGCEGLLALLLILSVITGLDSSKEQRLRWILVIVLLAYHLVTQGSKSSGEGNAHLGSEVEGHPLPEQLDS